MWRLKRDLVVVELLRALLAVQASSLQYRCFLLLSGCGVYLTGLKTAAVRPTHRRAAC